MVVTLVPLVKGTIGLIVEMGLIVVMGLIVLIVETPGLIKVEPPVITLEVEEVSVLPATRYCWVAIMRTNKSNNFVNISNNIIYLNPSQFISPGFK